MGLIALPAIPWVLGALGVGAGAHVVAPGRAERERAVAQGLANLMSRADDDANSRAAPQAITDTCTDCPEPDECLVGAYDAIKDACRARGGETHHIIPDMVYRTQAASTPGAKTSPATRAPGAPTYGQGQSVCLSRPDHRGLGQASSEGVHPGLEHSLSMLGLSHDPTGTAPMHEIALASTAALDRASELSPECRERARIAATGQANGPPGPLAPGRTSRHLPSPSAETVILRGSY